MQGHLGPRGLHLNKLGKGLLGIATVKNLKIGTPEIITIIVLQLEQLDFTVQYCVQKMQIEQQTEKTLIRLLHEEQSDLSLHW